MSPFPPLFQNQALHPLKERELSAVLHHLVLGWENSAGAGGVVKLVEGIWADERLLGLGTSGSDPDDVPVDARNEEICGIWEQEKSRLTKDLKSLVTA